MMNELSELDNKDISVESIAEKALKDGKVLSALLECVLSKNDTIRFNSHEVLLLLSEEHPTVLHSSWDFLEDLLDSDNNYHKFIALNLIANLTKIDTANRFERMFDKYYSILDGERTMAAAHVAAKSGKIARAKPHLQAEITNRLLNIDKTHRGKQKELLKGHAIEALSEYFEEAEDKKRIIEFARQQLKSESPRTRKAAEKFLGQ